MQKSTTEKCGQRSVSRREAGGRRGGRKKRENEDEKGKGERKREELRLMRPQDALISWRRRPIFIMAGGGEGRNEEGLLLTLMVFVSSVKEYR